MDEILRHLPPCSRVLDLGCNRGSFDRGLCPDSLVVRVDSEVVDVPPGEVFVQADAAQLPFRDGSFAAVISNHSLEHIGEPELALLEVGRVIRAEGALFVAVPDASTFSDRIYRWIYHGGGHINGFQSAAGLSALIVRTTGLRPAGFRELCTSFGFLHKRHFLPRSPRRLWLFGNGSAGFIMTLSYAARLCDRFLGTRWSAYGWAFYFGAPGEAVRGDVWRNVCVQCGASHSSDFLIESGRVSERGRLVRSYRCPACETRNLFTTDS